MGCRVKSNRFRGWGAGLRVFDSGRRDLEMKVEGSRFRVKGLGLRVKN